MSNAATQYAAFCRDVARHKIVWTLRDKGGFPAPQASSGKRAHPFWSSKSRVQRIIKTVPAYAGFEPFEIRLDDFVARWLSVLEKDDLLVGVNWSGPRAQGYDVRPDEVLARIEFELSKILS